MGSPAACGDCCKSDNVKGRAALSGNVSLSWTGKRGLHTPELLPTFSGLGSSNHWSMSKKSRLPWVTKISHNGVHNGLVLLWPFSLVHRTFKRSSSSRVYWEWILRRAPQARAVRMVGFRSFWAKPGRLAHLVAMLERKSSAHMVSHGASSL